MSLMDVFVKIGADTSDLESGVKKTEGIVGKLGQGFGNAMKVAGAAVGAASAAVGAFAVSSVKAGATFDSSMAQVAATMGVTVDEIGELRDFAMDMGAKTAFSATQAADALNYMALAGYDAETSMEMLPNVLNLAAAGNMELATASDMVTDAQSALGLSLEETTDLVDMMAKTSSKSNTSVQQLGDAILTVGGTAKTLAGGTNELNTALGILADNGIKGSEGGTKLRNVILSLSSPTDKAAQMLEQLGVQAVDTATGDLKPLDEIMGDLSKSLEGMGTADKADIINTIFNKQDIAAVNALLDTSADRWDELSAAIDDSAGAAEKMAETQLDNLNGDITLFKSALEGAQILVSDALTPSLREFVQFGTEGLGKISDAFKEGGLTGAMDAFGEVLADGLNMIVEKAPQFVDAGLKLLGALGKGILDNADVVLSSVLKIGEQIGSKLIEAAPLLIKGAIGLLLKLGQYLTENIGTIIPSIIGMVADMANMLAENAEALVNGAIQLIMAIGKSLIENAGILIPAIVELAIAMADALISNAPLLLQGMLELLKALAKTIIDYAPYIIEAIGRWMLLLPSHLAQWGGQIMSSIGAWFGGLVSSIGQWMSNAINTVVQWLSQLPSKMAYWAGYAIASFIMFVAELPSNIAKIFTLVVEKVTTFARTFAEKAREAAKMFFNNLVNGITSLPSRLSALGNQLVGAVSNLPSKFMQVGKNIVDGLWNGISNGWNWLKDKVAGLADSLLQGAKDALGIHSPSKKFMWVGQMIDEGLASGIEKFSYLVDGSLGKLGAVSYVNTIDEEPQLAFAGGYGGGYGGDYNQTVNIYSPTALTPSEVARQTRNATRDMVLELRGKR